MKKVRFAFEVTLFYKIKFHMRVEFNLVSE